MVAVDTSAILAILLAKEEAPEFRDLIGEAGGTVVSTLPREFFLAQKIAL